MTVGPIEMVCELRDKINNAVDEDKKSISCEPVTPFLKWLGGKRWLMPFLKEKLSDSQYSRYIEPFLGGGASFFYIRLKPALLSDLNSQLINTYIQVRDNPQEIIRRLRMIPVNAQTYYRMRSLNPASSIVRAVRFLYLNRTAFSGVYRVNGKGEFNVPFGHYQGGTRILWEQNLIINASQALEGSHIFCSDFETAVNNAKKGDLLYCDPTYTTMHNNNGFRKYNEVCFSWADQERLANACHRAASRGATVVVSNAYHSEIRNLYDGFEAITVDRNSVLCPDSSKRRPVQEYLFISK